MDIKILGTRGEIEATAPYHSRHSGILIDETLLLDFGEKDFLNDKPKFILITHLHPDHAFFIRHPHESINVEIPIYGPEKYRNHIIVEKLSRPKRFGRYEIIPIPTHHSHRVASQAYLIQKGNEKILYTGDMIWINKEYHPLLQKLDLVITEGSYLRRGGFIKKHPESGKLYGHAGIPDLIKLFKPLSLLQNYSLSRAKF